MLRRRGVIDPEHEKLAKGRQILVADALTAFDRSLENTTPEHRNLTMTRVRRLVEAGGFVILGDLNAERVEESLKAIRKEDDLGARTYNHYLQAIDEFGKWLVASKAERHRPAEGERLAGAGLTVPEIAAILDCSERTLYRRFAAALKEGHTRMCASLKRQQFIVAMRGSVSMLIWLGKQYLGQKDRVANEHLGPDGKAFEVVLHPPDNGRDANPATEPVAVEEAAEPVLRLA
jgi:hypothetical protein